MQMRSAMLKRAEMMPQQLKVMAWALRILKLRTLFFPSSSNPGEKVSRKNTVYLVPLVFGCGRMPQKLGLSSSCPQQKAATFRQNSTTSNGWGPHPICTNRPACHVTGCLCTTKIWCMIRSAKVIMNWPNALQDCRPFQLVGPPGGKFARTWTIQINITQCDDMMVENNCMIILLSEEKYQQVAPKRLWEHVRSFVDSNL